MGLWSALNKLLDPRGPASDVLSTDSFWKERTGLPIAAPHSARANLPAPAHLEATLAAPRFVSMSEATSVPKDRVRQVSAFVEEHWQPVMQKTDSTDIATILLTSQQQIGWKVTQRQSQASRHVQSAEQFQEVLQSANIQASDEFYAGYYETIPGNDPVILDGEILRAQDGTIIRGGTQVNGRTDYRSKTKNMVLWDKGYVRERLAAQAELESRPVRNVKANLERVKGECLPMRRLLANPRVDRRSAV